MKFTRLNENQEIQRIQFEIQDQVADRDDLAGKADKVINIKRSEPRLTDMADGDIIYYTDGTTDYRYTRISSRLYIEQMNAAYVAGTGVTLAGGGGGASLTISKSSDADDDVTALIMAMS